MFKNLSSAPDASKAPHVLRWWNHINSFSESERNGWGSAAVSTASKKDEEEFDLFGEDEDDAAHEEEIERRAQEQLAKKAASGKKVVMKSVVVIDVKPWEDSTGRYLFALC